MDRDGAGLVVEDQVHRHQRSVVLFLPLGHFGVTRFDLLQEVSNVCERKNFADDGEAGRLDYRLFPFGISCFGPW